MKWNREMRFCFYDAPIKITGTGTESFYFDLKAVLCMPEKHRIVLRQRDREDRMEDKIKLDENNVFCWWYIMMTLPVSEEPGKVRQRNQISVKEDNQRKFA